MPHSLYCIDETFNCKMSEAHFEPHKTVSYVGLNTVTIVAETYLSANSFPFVLGILLQKKWKNRTPQNTICITGFVMPLLTAKVNKLLKCVLSWLHRGIK